MYENNKKLDVNDDLANCKIEASNKNQNSMRELFQKNPLSQKKEEMKQ